MNEHILPPPPKKPSNDGVNSLLPPPPKKDESDESKIRRLEDKLANGTADEQFFANYQLAELRKRKAQPTEAPASELTEASPVAVGDAIPTRQLPVRNIQRENINAYEILRGKRSDAHDFKTLVPSSENAERAFMDLEDDYLDYLKETDQNKYEETASALRELRAQKATGDLSLGQQEHYANIRKEAANLKNKAQTQTIRAVRQSPEYLSFKRKAEIINAEYTGLKRELDDTADPIKQKELSEKINLLVARNDELKQETGYDKVEQNWDNALSNVVSPASVRLKNIQDFPELNETEVSNRIMQDERDKSAKEGNTETTNAFVGTVAKMADSALQGYKIMGDLVGDTDYDWADELSDKMAGETLEREGEYGELSGDLPKVYKLSRIAGQTAASIAAFAAGGTAGGASKAGQMAGVFTTSMATTVPDYYNEAKALGKSPKEAAKEATLLAFTTSLIETAVPDVKYFQASAFRKSVLKAVKDNWDKPFSYALKEAVQALPDATKSYLKSATKEGLEELTQQGVEDVTKEGLNAATGGEDYQTFNPENYVQSFLGGFMAGGGMNVFSRPDSKPPDVETVMRDAVDNRETIISDMESVNPEKAAEVKSVLESGAESLDALSKHSGWDSLDKEDQDHAFALTQQLKAVEEEQKAIAGVRLEDKAKEEEIKKIEEELNGLFETKAPDVSGADVTKPLTKTYPMGGSNEANVEEKAEHSNQDAITKAPSKSTLRSDVALNIEFFSTKKGPTIGTALIKKDDGYYYHVDGVETKIPDQKRAQTAFELSKANEAAVHANSQPANLNDDSNLSDDVNDVKFEKTETASEVMEVPLAESADSDIAVTENKEQDGENIVQLAAELDESDTGTGVGGRVVEEVQEKRSSIGVTNAYSNAVREAAGADPIAKAAGQTNSELWERMVSRINNGELDPRQTVREIAESEKPAPTDENQAQILFDRIRIMNEKEAVLDLLQENISDEDDEKYISLMSRMAALESEQNLNDVANDKLGTEWGRTGQFRQFLAERDYSASKMIKMATGLNRGNELSSDQKIKFETLAKEHEVLQRQLKKMLDRQHEQETIREEKKKQKVSEGLRKFADRIEKGQISKLAGFRSSTGFDAVWDLSIKTVAESLRAGATIADAIEIGMQKIRESKWYQDLKDKGEDFENKFRDHLTSEYDKTTDPEEYLKRRQTRLNNLNKKIDSGDFGKKPKPVPPQSPEIRNINRKIREVEERVDYEMEKVRLKNRKGEQVRADTFYEILNMPKSLLSGLDFSAPFRQGIFLIGKPTVFAKAFGSMMVHAFSPETHTNWLRDLRSSDEYYEMKESGLYLSEPNAVLQAREEQYMSRYIEYVQNPYSLIGTETVASRDTRVALRVATAPLQGYGVLMKASQRAYVGFLNVQRVQTFRIFRDNLKMLNIDEETFKRELAGYARFINNATGRGNLGFAESAAPLLNGAMYSPRLLASRVTLLNPVFYAKLPKRARKDAVLSFFKFAAIAGLVGVMSKLAWGCPDDCKDCKNCVDVEFDPRSTEFLKIKYNSTYYDILGGFQQILTALAKVITGQKKDSKTGKVNDLTFPKSTTDVMGDFLVSKSSPSFGVALDIIRRKSKYPDSNGSYDVTLTGEMSKLVVPLNIQTAAEVSSKNGGTDALVPIILSTFGVGVQEYGDKKKQPRKK